MCGVITTKVYFPKEYLLDKRLLSWAEVDWAGIPKSSICLYWKKGQGESLVFQMQLAPWGSANCREIESHSTPFSASHAHTF